MIYKPSRPTRTYRWRHFEHEFKAWDEIGLKSCSSTLALAHKPLLMCKPKYFYILALRSLGFSTQIYTNLFVVCHFAPIRKYLRLWSKPVKIKQTIIVLRPGLVLPRPRLYEKHFFLNYLRWSRKNHQSVFLGFYIKINPILKLQNYVNNVWTSDDLA